MARKRKKIGSAVKTPYLHLGQAIEVVKQVYELIGGSASEDEFSTILGNSVKSSSFNLKVQAVKNFNLIEQAAKGQRIVLSALGKRIFAATSPEERAHAVQEAFLRVRQYKALYEAYAGKLLPTGEFLLNAIVQHCKVPSQLTNQWKDSFMASGAAAGLFQERADGKIQVRLAPGRSTEQPQEEASMQGEDQQRPGEERRFREQPTRPVDFESFKFPLLDGRIGVVQFSKGWTVSDVKKMLELMRVAFLWSEAEAKKAEAQ